MAHLGLTLAIVLTLGMLWQPAPLVAAAGEPVAADAEPASDAPSAVVNVYLAPEGLSPLELTEYLLAMREKPASVRRRAGFYEALLDGGVRLYAVAEPDSKRQAIALLAKFEALHMLDEQGDADAAEAIQGLAQLFADDQRPDIAYEAAFHLLRARVDQADKLPPEALPELLADLREFAKRRKLENRHLLLASGTVGIINRLASDEEAAKCYREFGGIFALSSDKELSAYGKKITKAAPPISYVGKELQLDGPTAKDAPFDWASYRGKVVVVFYWSIDNRQSMAEVASLKRLLEKYREQGLEIVGISFDQDQEALEQTLEAEQIPWVNLIGQEKEGQWTVPLAEMYSVKNPPANFVVGRNGKVAAENLRGDMLDQRVAELLKRQAAADGAEDSPAQDTPADDSPVEKPATDTQPAAEKPPVEKPAGNEPPTEKPAS